jgi:hypothetical protein
LITIQNYLWGIIILVRFFCLQKKNDHVGKWLTRFCGLHFLPSNEVEDCFVEELMVDAPENEA